MPPHNDSGLGKILNRRSFAEGDIIFHEGDKGTQAYVVQRGRVRIVKNMSDGKQGTLGFIEPGGIFGEMALMDNSPRMATAVAEDSTVLISITEETLKDKLKQSSPVVKMILMVMIKMLRNMSDDANLVPIEISALSENN